MCTFTLFVIKVNLKYLNKSTLILRKLIIKFSTYFWCM